MAINESLSNASVLEKLHGTHSSFMRKMGLSKNLVVDARKGDPLWQHVKVAFMPIGPKHFFGGVLPHVSAEITHLQKEWETGQDSFPAMIFFHMGTQGHKGEFAMVRSEDFTKTPEALLASIQRAQEDLGVQNVEYRIRSLECVYTAVAGKLPPGSNKQPPFEEFPTQAW